MAAVSPARLASLWGIGGLRPAPGTWGSAAVLPLALLPGWVAMAACAAFTLAGFWALRRLPEAGQDPDWVVVDEAAGMSLALAFAASPSGAALAFALFRLFDIWKPGPVGWADRQPGPVGVMADDLVAGALAALGVIAFHAAGLG
ncbi:MAG: phosphatidylglycerophosphatase A [Roseococcus sp.]|nr:phosphatidylglycerophosphatase A [Roseococcus sp.]